MFYVWVGIMTGALLAYLWGRSREGTRPHWRSPRWWLAAAALLLLLAPLAWDAWKTGFGNFGPIESVRAVLLPWAAGVGFGVWLNLIIAGLPRESSLTFVPLLLALGFVTLIVSEDRYSWLSRLQKVTFGGGGVEFAPAATGSRREGATPAISSAGASTDPGVRRVEDLIVFLKDLNHYIEEDINFAHELNHLVPINHGQNLFAQFAHAVGERLDVVHYALSFNTPSFFFDGELAFEFRNLIERHSVPSSDGLVKVEQLFRKVAEKACREEEHLLLAEALNREDLIRRGILKRDPTGTKEVDKFCVDRQWDGWTADTSDRTFDPAFPYGTLLAAKLLNALGELRAALNEIDWWDKRHGGEIEADSKVDEKAFALHRALSEAARMAHRNRDRGGVPYSPIPIFQRAVAVGDRILMQPAWRITIKNVIEKGYGVDPVWLSDGCSPGLSKNFRKFFRNQASLANTFLYQLSQNLAYAKHEGLVKTMDDRAKYLGKLRFSCLRLDATREEQEKLDGIEAAFVDTAAAVNLVLAAEEERVSEKRDRLCVAKRHSQHSFDIAQRLAADRQASGRLPGGKPRWSLVAAAKKEQKRLEAIDAWADYSSRLDQIKLQLAITGLECTT